LFTAVGSLVGGFTHGWVFAKIGVDNHLNASIINRLVDLSELEAPRRNAAGTLVSQTVVWCA